MKKNSPFSLSALIFITFALAAISTGIVLARANLPARQNNASVRTASLNSASSKLVIAQSTPEPTLEAAPGSALESTQNDSSMEATETPEAENMNDANMVGELENAQAMPNSSSGNSFSENGSADQSSNSVSTKPSTSIANPFSSDGSAERLLKSGSARPTTRIAPSIANPFSSEISNVGGSH